MAKSKIESDPGLNLRMFATGFALVLLYAIIVTVLIRIGLSYGIVIVIAAAMLFS